MVWFGRCFSIGLLAAAPCWPGTIPGRRCGTAIPTASPAAGSSPRIPPFPTPTTPASACSAATTAAGIGEAWWRRAPSPRSIRKTRKRSSPWAAAVFSAATTGAGAGCRLSSSGTSLPSPSPCWWRATLPAGSTSFPAMGFTAVSTAASPSGARARCRRWRRSLGLARRRRRRRALPLPPGSMRRARLRPQLADRPQRRPGRQLDGCAAVGAGCPEAFPAAAAPLPGRRSSTWSIPWVRGCAVRTISVPPSPTSPCPFPAASPPTWRRPKRFIWSVSNGSGAASTAALRGRKWAGPRPWVRWAREISRWPAPAAWCSATCATTTPARSRRRPTSRPTAAAGWSPVVIEDPQLGPSDELTAAGPEGRLYPSTTAGSPAATTAAPPGCTGPGRECCPPRRRSARCRHLLRCELHRRRPRDRAQPRWRR